MSDAAIFLVIFAGLFVLRIVAATAVFFVLLPKGDRCPHCDSATVRVQSWLLDRTMPWFRSSWCYECGWEGVLRRGPLSEQALSRHEVGRRQQQQR